MSSRTSSRDPRRVLAWACLTCVPLFGCSSGAQSPSLRGGVGGSGTTGAPNTGGFLSAGGLAGIGGATSASGGMATGGTSPANGGANAAGGSLAAGGTIATGGATAAGGAVATGGAKATGGATAAGGVAAIGGTAATTGGTKATGGAPGTGGVLNCDTPPGAPELVGWAAPTTGGGNATPVTVTSLSALNTQAAGTTARVIYVTGALTTGTLTIGSNKTIVGLCGAVIRGHIEISGSTNVILRNIAVQGNNCSDATSDCSAGADAISIKDGANHIWLDHLDIYDGSDGNLDITNGADFVTVSWTKFRYSTARVDPGNNYGHRFSTLIGGSDTNSSEDSGHLNTTFHHCWWGTNVAERMPRTRFGKIHLFNNLYTAVGNADCVMVGISASVRIENNAFVSVKDPIDTTTYVTGGATATAVGNIYTATTGVIGANVGTAFTPTYTYTLEAGSTVRASVESGAGPR